MIRAAAAADPEQLPGTLAADLVRRVAADPGTARLDTARLDTAMPANVTVAAVIVQTGAADPAAPSLTALATRLADDVKELLQGEPSSRPITAAVAVAGPVVAAGLDSARAGGAGPSEWIDRLDLGDLAASADRSDPIAIDRARRRVLVAGHEMDLTYREFELLAFLAEHPGRVFSRAHLLRTVWDDAPVGSRTVDVHVRRLRMKLGPAAGRITTVRSVGYRLEQAPADARSLEPVA